MQNPTPKEISTSHIRCLGWMLCGLFLVFSFARCNDAPSLPDGSINKEDGSNADAGTSLRDTTRENGGILQDRDTSREGGILQDRDTVRESGGILQDRDASREGGILPDFQGRESGSTLERPLIDRRATDR